MAIIKKYKAEVISKLNPAPDLFFLEFISHSGTFRFSPGQFLHLALDEYDSSFAWPESRCFSIQTPPQNEFLRITFSVKGSFTQRMANEIKVGQIIDLKMPFGDLFNQNHNKYHTIFISGGTGITPFLSLFNDQLFSEYKNPKLFAGFRYRELNLYSSEIESALQINPNLKIKYVYQNEEGIININDVYKSAKTNASFFISGPLLMINTFRTRLIELGINENRIISDNWE